MIHLKLSEIFGKLPTSEYDMFDRNIGVGKIQIRHKPSSGESIPETMASHIYYEIYPEFRSKGYGTVILRLGLLEAQKIGLKEVFVTCMEDNLASKKIIEANRGILIDNAIVSNSSKKMLKYKIDLR